MKHFWTIIEVPYSDEHGVSFVVQLRNKTRFILNDCYFTICKDVFEPYPDSDYFQVDLVGDFDINVAKEKIKRAVDILIYLTGIPYEVRYVEQDDNVLLDAIDISYSKTKIERINEINSQYGKIRSKRALLENTLRLYALATNYSVILGDAEEAFFASFRILEKIAKDEFEIEKKEIGKGVLNVKYLVQKVLEDDYGIKMPVNKIDDLAGNLATDMFNTVFSDIYAKIAWFCARRNITYDENILIKCVKTRNALAHGENVRIDYNSEEYSFVVKMSDKFIHEKFFTNIKKCYLESKLID